MSPNTAEAGWTPEVAARAERWAHELEWSESAVEYDPTNAFDVSRRAERELEEWAAQHPEQRQALAELIARARVDHDRNRAARDRFCADGAAREREHHERELAEIREPLASLRRPYRGVDSA